MKTKTKIILGIVGLVFIATGAVLYTLYSQGFFFDKSPIYGTFEYKNEDGSIAKVVLTETTVYCENVDYEVPMKNASYYTVMDDLEEESNGNSEQDIDTSEIIKREKVYLEQWDFESAFDKKISKIDNSSYYEDELGHMYIYEVKYPETGSYGLDIYVSLDDKTLVMGTTEFKYIGE